MHSYTIRAALRMTAAAAVVALLLSGCAHTGIPTGTSTTGVPVSGTATGGPASATGSAASGGTGTSAPQPSTAPAHVVLVVFENKAYRQIVGSPSAPWFNGLLASSAVFTAAHAITHPSQPNYLALFSGSTQAVTDDHCLSGLGDRANLASQLAQAGRSFVGYAEGLPAPGYRGCSVGRYAAKHNPWANFANVPDGADQPFSAFPQTFPSDFPTLPTVAFVVPDLCDDMHDCSVATGDAWARAHLQPYLSWAQSHRSVLIVTFDENDNSPGNQIFTVIAGDGVRPGQYPQLVNHYSVLATIEAWYGLGSLGGAAVTGPITGVWASG